MRIVLFVIILMSADDDEMENSLNTLCVCASVFILLSFVGGWAMYTIFCWNICGLCNAFKVMDGYTQNSHTHTYIEIWQVVEH